MCSDVPRWTVAARFETQRLGLVQERSSVCRRTSQGGNTAARMETQRHGLGLEWSSVCSDVLRWTVAARFETRCRGLRQERSSVRRGTSQSGTTATRLETHRHGLGLKRSSVRWLVAARFETRCRGLRQEWSSVRSSVLHRTFAVRFETLC